MADTHCPANIWHATYIISSTPFSHKIQDLNQLYTHFGFPLRSTSFIRKVDQGRGKCWNSMKSLSIQLSLLVGGQAQMALYQLTWTKQSTFRMQERQAGGQENIRGSKAIMALHCYYKRAEPEDWCISHVFFPKEFQSSARVNKNKNYWAPVFESILLLPLESGYHSDGLKCSCSEKIHRHWHTQ